EAGAPMFDAVSPVSTNNALLTADATYVYYQPANNDPAYDVVDRFSYTVSDGFLTATGSVVVNIAPDPPNPFASLVAHGIAPDGNLSITFAGVPGRAYLVQAASNLAAPIIWETLSNNVNGGFMFIAPTNGLWTHVDLNSTNFGIRFYRTALP